MTVIGPGTEPNYFLSGSLTVHTARERSLSAHSIILAHMLKSC